MHNAHVIAYEMYWEQVENHNQYLVQAMYLGIDIR